MHIVAFVLVLLLAIVLVNALIWVPIIVWMKRKRVAAVAALETELATSGERTVRGPERGLYRGGSGGYSGVSGTATMVLTDRRLLFVKATGGRVDVPRDQIASVRESKAFRGAIRGRQVHVVMSMKGGAEVGFIAANPQEWLVALT